MFAIQNLFKTLNGILKTDILAFKAGEDLGSSEGLGHEFLNFTGSFDGEFVFFGELVHAENGDDVLQGLVVLKDFLDTGGGVVVLLADNTGVEHAGLTVQGIDGGINTCKEAVSTF